MNLTLPTLSQPLKLWEKIELVVGDDSETGHYMSRIEDFLGESIIISNPQFLKGKSLLRDNDLVTVLITREDAIYEFGSRITKCQTSGNEMFQLSPPNDVKRLQRRRFARVNIGVEVMYSRIMEAETDENDYGQLHWHVARVIDLSAGGILIQTANEFLNEDVVLLKIGLFEDIDLPSPIAAKCHRVSGTEGDRRIGLEFILQEDLPRELPGYNLKYLPNSVRGFNSKSQMVLEAFVFRRQIEMRKKGLL